MRIALECAAEGDAEGAYFWRDHMSYCAFVDAMMWRDRPDDLETYERPKYSGGTEDATPSIGAPPQGRDLMEFGSAQYEPAIVLTADEEAARAALEALNARALEPIPVIAKREVVTTGLLATFAPKVSAPTPAAEPEKSPPKKLTSLLGLL